MSTDTPTPEDDAPQIDAPTPEAPVTESTPVASSSEPESAPVVEEPDVPPTTPAEPVAPAEPAVPAVEVAEPSIASGLEIGSEAEIAEEEELIQRPDPVIRGKVDRFGVAWGTGRRKTAVARVRLKDGTGQISINGRSIDDYFPIERDRKLVHAPLKATELDGKVDIIVNVQGGGPTGQTGAVVLGVARAIQAKNPELHHLLSDGGFLTRDGRMVERKKYGFKKARKSFQFSKR